MEFDKFLSHVCYAVRGAATARGRSPYQDRAPSALQLFCRLLLPELKNITDIYVRKKISKLGLFIGCKHWFHDLLCTEEKIRFATLFLLTHRSRCQSSLHWRRQQACCKGRRSKKLRSKSERQWLANPRNLPPDREIQRSWRSVAPIGNSCMQMIFSSFDVFRPFHSFSYVILL